MKRFLPLSILLCMLYGVVCQAQTKLYPQCFPLDETIITDGPFRVAQDLNIRNLLKYDVDRLLTPYVRQAGLSATDDTSSPYYRWEERHPNHANWGSDGFRLDGHVGGHYLTALALAWNVSSDSHQKAELAERMDYMLRVMDDCQKAFRDDEDGMRGFIGGQPINYAWRDFYHGNTDAWNKVRWWVPFYCEHKIMAGLRDVAVYATGARARKAQRLFRGMCDWSIRLISHLSDEQMQNILDTEHGGMNEMLVDAYRLFGDRRYLEAAYRYSHETMVSNMQSANERFLDGKHANTQVPKYIGFERIAQEDATAKDYAKAARVFWDDVVQHRTVCIGGNSVNEHFTSDGNQYINEMDGPESCNSNNMMKLSEMLFCDTHQAQYMDFYENVMYNHILSTQDPLTGGYVYFTPLRPQAYRIYSVENQDMWCCVGTGMENHCKYGQFIYTHSEDNRTLYVNLFTPSILRDRHFGICQETGFPYSQSSKLTVTRGGDYTIAIRRPAWVAAGFSITVGGKSVDVSAHTSSSYVMLDGPFHEGDEIEVSLPMTLRYEECPHKSDYIAFKFGPLLLGARTSKPLQNLTTDYSACNLPNDSLPHEYARGERMGHSPGSYIQRIALSQMPKLIGVRATILQRISAVGKDAPLSFTIDVSRTDSVSDAYRWKTLLLEPYYTLHHSRNIIYWYQNSRDDVRK